MSADAIHSRLKHGDGPPDNNDPLSNMYSRSSGKSELKLEYVTFAQGTS